MRRKKARPWTFCGLIIGAWTYMVVELARKRGTGTGVIPTAPSSTYTRESYGQLAAWYIGSKKIVFKPGCHLQWLSHPNSNSTSLEKNSRSAQTPPVMPLTDDQHVYLLTRYPEFLSSQLKGATTVTAFFRVLFLECGRRWPRVPTSAQVVTAGSVEVALETSIHAQNKVSRSWTTSN